MKKLLSILFLSLGLVSVNANASDNNVGVVDVLKINAKAKVMLSLNKQKDAAIEKIKKNVDANRKTFEKEQNELSAKKVGMSEESFIKEAQAFQMKLYNFDKKTEEQLAKVEKAYVEVLKTLQNDYLDRIIKDIAKDKGFSVVINSQTAIIINDKLDITDDVIKNLNDEIKEIELKV